MSDTKGQPAAPKASWIRGKRDLFAAIASGFVAMLALATSMYNVYLQRQQVRAQVWPRLSVGVSLNDDALSFVVANHGVGPAEVRRVRVLVDGKPARDWTEVEHAMLGPGPLGFVAAVDTLENDIVSAGAEHHWLTIPDRQAAIKMLAQRRRLAIEVCYCSTLDECWTNAADFASTGDVSRPQPVAQCAPDAVPFTSVAGEDLDAVLAHMADGGLLVPKEAKK